MPKIIVTILIGFIAFVAWQIGGRMNPDALGLSLGVIFGMMAGIPAALIVVTARRGEPYQPQRRTDLLESSTAIVPHTTSYYVVEDRNEINRLQRHRAETR